MEVRMEGEEGRERITDGEREKKREGWEAKQDARIWRQRMKGRGVKEGRRELLLLRKEKRNEK